MEYRRFGGLGQEGAFFTATEILVDLFCFALNSYKGMYKMNNELDPVTNSFDFTAGY
jgi:hypothetical protein